MKKILLSALFIILCATLSLAQSAGDYNKVEFYGGYSHSRMESTVGTETVSFTGGSLAVQPCTSDGRDVFGGNFQHYFCDRRGFNGFDTSIAYNFRRYFGVKANFTAHFNSDRFVDTFGTGAGSHTDTNNTRDRIYSVLAGLQIKNNSKTAKFKPFAHALFGFAHLSSTDTQTSVGGGNFVVRDTPTNFAMKLGGGLDVRVSRKIDLRLIEFDYSPIFGGNRNPSVTTSDFSLAITGRTANNFSVGFGIVIH
ncbi:MAG TPA: hypothetical protein VKB86_18625 [Pyrinomonadaceae bacterium]|nr:hypothetical protein [Pyrinomonadaceae bacterium]